MLKIKSGFIRNVKTELRGMNLNIGHVIDRFNIVSTISSIPQLKFLNALPFVESIEPDKSIHAPEFPESSYGMFLTFASLPTPDAVLNETSKILSSFVPGVSQNKEPSEGWIPTSKVVKWSGAYKANDSGYYGKGVRVAVLDTCGLNLPPQQFYDYTPITAMTTNEFLDLNGHGKHVATIIAGPEYRSPTTGLLCRGFAPKATVVGIKCLGGVMGMGMNSDLLKAIDIAIEKKCKVVNMSLGSEDPDEYSVTCEIIDAATEKYEMIFVVAIGNSGDKPGTAGDPAIAKSALSVGAGSIFDDCASYFSSRGPANVTGEIKPDCIMPGGGRKNESDKPMEGIYSSTAVMSLLDSLSEDNQPDGFAAMPGSSQATPGAAGEITLAVEMGVIKTVWDVKDKLKSMSSGKNNDEGWGWLYWDTLMS